MARQRFEPRISPVIAKPTAAPVDTYVRPGVSPAEQLAQALAQVDPQLQRFSQVMSQNIVDSKKAEGERAARIHSEQALAAGGATRSGDLPMQDNPYFMAGYKEENGRVAAGLWQSDFKAMLEQDENLKSSINMADFDKAAGSHISNWFKQKQSNASNFERDEFFEKGFGHMKDQYLAAERLAFANGIEGKLDKGSDEQLFAMVKRGVTDNWGTASPEAIARDIDTMVSMAVKRGRPEGKARPMAAAAIAAAARELGPEKGLQVLNLLDKASGEGGLGRLKDQSYGAKALDTVRKDLIVEAQQEAERARQAKRQAKEDRIEEISSGAMKMLVKNPAANLEAFIRDNPDAPPETVAILRGLQAQWSDVKYTTNQAVYNDLFNRIYDPTEAERGVTVHEIISKSRNQNLRTEDANRLIGMLEVHRNRGKGEKDPLDEKAEPYWKLAYNFLEDVWRDKVGGFVPAENVERVRNSRALLHYQWESLKASGKAEKMTSDELNKWFIEAGNQIRGTQQSDLQRSLKFQPPTSPNIGAGGGEKAAKLPEAALLTPKDFADIRLGKTKKIEELMRKHGIPPSRMREFITDQSSRSSK